MRRMLFLLLPLLLALAGPASAASYRCNSSLVTKGDHVQEVLSKCGEPVSQSLIRYKSVIDDWGFRHEVPVEEWTYGPRNGMYHVLRFEGGRLIGVDSRRTQ